MTALVATQMASGAVGQLPVPMPPSDRHVEIVDDVVDYDVVLGTPGPFGPHITTPKVNILWVDFQDNDAGLEVTAQFQDLGWSPDTAISYGAGGDIEGPHYSFLVEVYPDDGPPDRARLWVDGRGYTDLTEHLIVDMVSDQIVVLAPWSTLTGVENGDVLTRTAAGALERYEGNGSWSSNMVGDRAPNLEPYVHPTSFVRQRPTYGDDFTFTRVPA